MVGSVTQKQERIYQRISRDGLSKRRVASTWQAIHPVKLQTLAGLPAWRGQAGCRQTPGQLVSGVCCRLQALMSVRLYLPAEP